MHPEYGAEGMSMLAEVWFGHSSLFLHELMIPEK